MKRGLAIIIILFLIIFLTSGCFFKPNQAKKDLKEFLNEEKMLQIVSVLYLTNYDFETLSPISNEENYIIIDGKKIEYIPKNKIESELNDDLTEDNDNLLNESNNILLGEIDFNPKQILFRTFGIERRFIDNSNSNFFSLIDILNNTLNVKINWTDEIMGDEYLEFLITKETHRTGITSEYIIRCNPTYNCPEELIELRKKIIEI
jgi:hypothetical protein